MPKLRFCGPKSEVSSDLAIVFFVAAGIAAVRFDLPDFGIVLPRGLATPPTLLRRRSIEFSFVTQPRLCLKASERWMLGYQARGHTRHLWQLAAPRALRDVGAAMRCRRRRQRRRRSRRGQWRCNLPTLCS